MHFCCNFAPFWEVISGTFSDFAKNGAAKSRVGRLENRPKSLSKMKKTRFENKGCKHMDFGWIFPPFWEAFWSILGAKALQKSSEILDAFLEAKQRVVTSNVGPARRNAQGPWEG